MAPHSPCQPGGSCKKVSTLWHRLGHMPACHSWHVHRACHSIVHTVTTDIKLSILPTPDNITPIRSRCVFLTSALGGHCPARAEGEQPRTQAGAAAEAPGPQPFRPHSVRLPNMTIEHCAAHRCSRPQCGGVTPAHASSHSCTHPANQRQSSNAAASQRGPNSGRRPALHACRDHRPPRPHRNGGQHLCECCGLRRASPCGEDTPHSKWTPSESAHEQGVVVVVCVCLLATLSGAHCTGKRWPLLMPVPPTQQRALCNVAILPGDPARSQPTCDPPVACGVRRPLPLFYSATCIVRTQLHTCTCTHTTARSCMITYMCCCTSSAAAMTPTHASASAQQPCACHTRAAQAPCRLLQNVRCRQHCCHTHPLSACPGASLPCARPAQLSHAADHGTGTYKDTQLLLLYQRCWGYNSGTTSHSSNR